MSVVGIIVQVRSESTSSSPSPRVSSVLAFSFVSRFCLDACFSLSSRCIGDGSSTHPKFIEATKPWSASGIATRVAVGGFMHGNDDGNGAS